jgi:hypothetical protein
MEHYSLFKNPSCLVKTSVQRGSARGVSPRSQLDHSHQKRLKKRFISFIRLFDERSEIFCENLFLQKMWRF